LNEEKEGGGRCERGQYESQMLEMKNRNAGIEIKVVNQGYGPKGDGATAGDDKAEPNDLGYGFRWVLKRSVQDWVTHRPRAALHAIIENPDKPSIFAGLWPGIKPSLWP